MEESKIAEIRKLYSEGNKIAALARQFQVSTTTIRYYVKDDYKQYVLRANVEWFKKLPLERRRFYYKKRLAYQTKYQHQRYTTDEVFRQKQIARAKRRKEKVE